MTTYKGINGFAVQSVASDPSPLDEGQVWYNNATYAFKLAALTTSGTWAAGGNLTTSLWAVGGAGTQTAALGFGGYNGTSMSNVTQTYNGTSWTNVPELLLYQICPPSGLDGSEDTTSIVVPRISLKVVISNLP